jgi:hypothetical protein
MRRAGWALREVRDRNCAILFVFFSSFDNDLIDLRKLGNNQICRWYDTGINLKACERV